MNRELQGASRTSMNEREDNVSRGSISLQCWVARVDLQTLQVDASACALLQLRCQLLWEVAEKSHVSFP